MTQIEELQQRVERIEKQLCDILHPYEFGIGEKVKYTEGGMDYLGEVKDRRYFYRELPNNKICRVNEYFICTWSNKNFWTNGLEQDTDMVSID